MSREINHGFSFFFLYILSNLLDNNGMAKEELTCSNCGAILHEDEKECPYCGSRNPYYVKPKKTFVESAIFNNSNSVANSSSNNAPVTTPASKNSILPIIILTLMFFTTFAWLTLIFPGLYNLALDIIYIGKIRKYKKAGFLLIVLTFFINPLAAILMICDIKE